MRGEAPKRSSCEQASRRLAAAAAISGVSPPGRRWLTPAGPGTSGSLGMALSTRRSGGWYANAQMRRSTSVHSRVRTGAGRDGRAGAVWAVWAGCTGRDGRAGAVWAVWAVCAGCAGRAGRAGVCMAFRNSRSTACAGNCSARLVSTSTSRIRSGSACSAAMWSKLCPELVVTAKSAFMPISS